VIPIDPLLTRDSARTIADLAFEQFRQALRARDIIPSGAIVADGSLQRCAAAGRPRRRDASYLLHLDGFPAGGLVNWRDGLGWERWAFDPGRALTAVERRELARHARTVGRARQAEAQQRHATARERAAAIWAAAPPAPLDHPYLLSKAVQAHGLRVYRGALLIPVRDMAGILHSLQLIGAGGRKRFLRHGLIRAMGCWIGEPPAADDATATVGIAEGFATAASLHEATGMPMMVAFHAANLVPLSLALRASRPQARIIVCADDDHRTEGNPGVTQGSQAAAQVQGLLAVPAFGAQRPEHATDFNDLRRLEGDAALRAAIAKAAVPNAAPRRSGVAREAVAQWPEPEPLATPLAALAYPLDALPPLLREAVLEAQAFVQAPTALVAASALAALSVAAQGLIDVRRDRQLVGPVSLYMLAVAESGERKTTCDRIFSAPLRDWERDRVRDAAGEQTAFDSASAVYEAKRTGLLEAIRRKRRDAGDTDDEEAALHELARDAPQAVAVPRLLYADATPEALAQALASGWPSGAVLSAEAGAVLGGHGMGYETILRNLALLNVLWDGGEIAVDRRTRPSFRLRERRLTFGLMAQPATLRGFLERAGTLPRGSGFIARFLIAWPESTQGTRRYRSAPAAMPAVARFGQRIRGLLDIGLTLDAQGGVQPAVLDLAPAAHATWVRAHDAIERALGPSGDYADIRDVASKAAENLARLAALFHALEHGPQGAIGDAAVRSAELIVTWHLHEARRLLADLDMPPDLATALRLDAWLRGEAQRIGDNRIPTTRIYQYGPAGVRDSKAFRTVLALLAERGRARLLGEGRRRFVLINPGLCDD